MFENDHVFVHIYSEKLIVWNRFGTGMHVKMTPIGIRTQNLVRLKLVLDQIAGGWTI